MSNEIIVTEEMAKAGIQALECDVDANADYVASIYRAMHAVFSEKLATPVSATLNVGNSMTSYTISIIREIERVGIQLREQLTKVSLKIEKHEGTIRLLSDQCGDYQEQLAIAQAREVRTDSFIKLVKRLFDEALPKFNWGASALDANAIQLLNKSGIEVAALFSLPSDRTALDAGTPYLEWNEETDSARRGYPKEIIPLIAKPSEPQGETP